MIKAFAIQLFRRLFVALAATMVADSVLLLTFGIWVKSLTGGLTSGMIISRIGHVPAMVLSLGLFAVSMGLMAGAPHISVVLVAAVPAGFGLPVMIVAINTLLQVRTPNRLMARVSTTGDAVIGIP